MGRLRVAQRTWREGEKIENRLLEMIGRPRCLMIGKDFYLEFPRRRRRTLYIKLNQMR